MRNSARPDAVNSAQEQSEAFAIWICSHSRPAQCRQKHVAERAYRRKSCHRDAPSRRPRATASRGGRGSARKKGQHPAAQIVFVDTPGVHKPGSQLDRRMLQEVHEALETRDLVLVLIDASRGCN